MSKILVLGGYGGFGARISRRLAAAGHEVQVAGRSRARAEAFCSDKGELTPLQIDRADIAAALVYHRPDVLVDASGPFQSMDYAVPRACIDARVPYCDIADSRTFVCGIATLDAEAKHAGVPIISGASSVPALSGAVARELGNGMDRICAVEMAISASNQASAGPAVSAAILGQVGKLFALRRGRRSTDAFGWQESQHLTFALPGIAPLGGRRVSLVDVPDHALLPDRLAGQPAVSFRAGTELGFQNVVLGLASWPVRWGWLRDLASFAGWLAPLQRLTANLGSDRSAMVVRMFGLVGDRRVERRWTLIADAGDGPEIPALSVPPLIERMLAGAEPPGARDAGEALALADYQPAFATLAIRHASEELTLPDALYSRVLGDRFGELPSSVSDMHQVLRDGGASGEADVTGAGNAAGTLVARIMRFPPPGTYPLHVDFSECDGEERWVRNFGSHRFSSRLSEVRSDLVERFGLMRFHFDLPTTKDGLTMQMKRWSIARIPLPLILAPRAEAREWEQDHRFHFDVDIGLPLIGRLVRYQGWLIRR